VRLRLREWRTPQRRYLEVGGLTLDTERRMAVSDGKRIHLATREYLLLEYLMRKRGEPCSRSELLEHVWGYRFEPGTNVVEVCVGRLRQKLGGSAIETIRNVGYCLAA
jgi:DNA-binding response OmpR family regulator